MSKPTVVILAGGENSRYFPLNTDQHKAGTVLAGQPLIVRTLNQLLDDGFSKFVIVAGSRDLAGQGLSALIARYQVKADITWVEQPKPLGMGDALLKARDFLDEQFIVTSAYHTQTSSLINKLLEADTPNAVLGTPTTTPWKFGILSVEDGRATGVVEKPVQGTEPSNLHVVSVYRLTPRFLEILDQTPLSQHNFEEALNTLMHQERVGVVQLPDVQGSLKYAWDLFDFWQEVKDELTSHRDVSANIASTAVLDESAGPVVIARGATIGHFVKIVGPCYVGEDVYVGDYSLVRDSSLEAGSVVGAYTEVARSLIMEHVTIHQSYLADSILGPHVKVGAGLVTANKRFDRQEIHTKLKEEMVTTKRTALGIIVGAHANIGIRVSTMPGVLIGAHQVVAPTSLLDKNSTHAN